MAYDIHHPDRAPEVVAAVEGLTYKQTLAWYKEHNLTCEGLPYKKNPKYPDKKGFVPRPNPWTKEEAAKWGAVGGRKAGVTKRRKKLYREMADAIISGKANKKIDEKTRKLLGDESPDTVTYYDATVAKLVSKACKGDTAAMKLLLDLAGEIDKSKAVSTEEQGDALSDALKEIGRALDQGKE